ncbi:hypothetical protein [Pedobacter polysacchareus]|uniref:hypothetical protein n=1 Tax=Pedobacter polysacchareus TaxID=2861973 RepID=UPI001C9A062A|nr:hypothetical protein [Pedobacter polysacchareus]
MKKMKLTYLLMTILAFSSCKKMMNVAPTVEKELVVTAFVGANAPAFQDGVGESTAFARPNSIAIDAAGNIFVADRSNARVRKVTPAGEVSTFVGSGIGGYQDGTGIAAKIETGNNAITIDAQNNLYLADQKNTCIRKITPAGVVSTLVGAPGRSNIDGPINIAGVDFTDQPDITIDASNNIYFLDRKGIRKISADGIVSTIVKTGNSTFTGPIATAVIANPLNICTDKAGNIYVSAQGFNDNSIVKVSTDGIVSIYAGAPASGFGYNIGLAVTAQFNNTRGMSADKEGNIYVVDNNHVIVKITTDGFVRLVAGVPYKGGAVPFVPGTATKAVFSDLVDVAVAPDGTIYASEYIASSIRKIALVDKPTTPPTQTEIDKANWNKPTNWK